MRGRIAAQVLLAIVASGCGGAVNREYTSPEGRYRVQFPGQPRLVEQPPIKTPWGPVVEKFAATETYQTIRFVSYSDYPGGLIHPGNAGSMLDDACQGWAAEKQLTILRKGPISVNGHSGRELNFEARPGSPMGKVSGRTRFFLVRGRLYHVGVIGPSGKVTPESIDGFLNSFALLEPGSQPSAAPVATAPPPVLRSPTGFYTIPEPATATLVADHAGDTRLGREDRLPSPASEDATTASPPTASAGGASIRSFEWIDENADLVGGHGDAARSDGNPDQHLRMVLDLPPNTIVEELVVKSQGFHRWETKPNDRFWPVAIFQQGRPVARAACRPGGRILRGSEIRPLRQYWHRDRPGKPLRGPGRALDRGQPGRARIGLQAAGAAIGLPGEGPTSPPAPGTQTTGDPGCATRHARAQPDAVADHRGPALATRRTGVGGGPGPLESLGGRRDDRLVRLARPEGRLGRYLGSDIRARRWQG